MITELLFGIIVLKGNSIKRKEKKKNICIRIRVSCFYQKKFFGCDAM